MAEFPDRQREMETRRLEDVAWREKIRAEDRATREKQRSEEVAWREKIRTEDRSEREKLRAEERAEREAASAGNRRCLARGLALIAAAQNAKTGAAGEDLVRMATGLSPWIAGDTEDGG